MDSTVGVRWVYGERPKDLKNCVFNYDARNIKSIKQPHLGPGTDPHFADALVSDRSSSVTGLVSDRSVL